MIFAQLLPGVYEIKAEAVGIREHHADGHHRAKSARA